MHPIRFRLGLRPRPCWRSSQRSSRPLGWILGSPTSKEREGEKKGTGRKGRGKRERGMPAGRERTKGERGGEGKEDEAPN